MLPRNYLPSTKLITIVLSLALSAGLVFAADRATHRSVPMANLNTDDSSDVSSDWEASLYAIQAQNASSAYAAPDPNLLNSLLESAKGPNLTESVGKSILINLSSAKSQGLGDDIPTQDQIIAAAAAQIKDTQTAPTLYVSNDLTIVEVSSSSLHAYGNAFIQSLTAHTQANEQATLLAIDYIVEGGDKSKIEALKAIGADYKAAALDLLKIPVPRTLVPLHLQAVNDVLRISATFNDMQLISGDPLRGLVALRLYESLMDEVSRVFINIAQNLSKGGILFSKDEPGSAWAVFLST